MTQVARLLRFADLKKSQIVPNRTTLARWMQRADDPFPAALQLGMNSIAWRESDVAAWLERRSQRTQPAEECRAS